MTATDHYESSSSEQQQHKQPSHHPTMNVETNLEEDDDEEYDEHEENADDENKEQHGEQANTSMSRGESNEENDQPLSPSQSSSVMPSKKKRRIRKRGSQWEQQKQQQQSVNGSSASSSEPTAVLMSPQQQQQPRRQRQRIVILQFDPVAADDDNDENVNVVAATEESRTTVTSPRKQQQQQQHDDNDDDAVVAITTTTPLGSPTSSFFSSEWLLTSISAPSSPITVPGGSSSTSPTQQQQQHSRSSMSAPAALLLADDKNVDNDNGGGTTFPSTSVCGGLADNHHENMLHGLRLLFHSDSNLLSLGGGNSTTETATGNNSNKNESSEEEDEDSVQSTPYFDMSDVAPIHWARALSEHDKVMVGLAVVVITISLAHPLLFLAGSLTALGTATAVGAGYDYVTTGPIGRCLGLTTATTTSTTTTSQWSDSSTSLPFLDETTTNDAARAPIETTTVDAAAVTAPVLAVHGKNIDIAAAAAATVVTPPVTNPKSDSATTLSSSCALMDVTANGTIGAEQILPENWVSIHYPPLEHYLFGENDKTHTEFQGLDVFQFFKVFYSDKAPFTYMEFQKKRGDKDIVYGLWNELPPKGPLSMHPAAATTTTLSASGDSSWSTNLFPLAEVDYIDYQSRILTFKTKTNNSFLGPPYATTTKEQRILIVSKKLAILEMKTTLADIPFCDRFHILERYIIQAEKVVLDQHQQQPAAVSNNSHDNKNQRLLLHNKNQHHHHHYYHCRITNASCQVFFLKSCPFETQIRTRSYASIEDVTTAWCHMATQALLLAEKAKLDREMAEQHENRQREKEAVVVVNENHNHHHREGFVDEKKENDDDNDTVSCRLSSQQETSGASSQVCESGDGGSGDDEEQAGLDVEDSIEVMHSSGKNNACVLVRDCSNMTSGHHSHDHDDHHRHRHHDKGANDAVLSNEIPDIVKIPKTTGSPRPEEEVEEGIEKKISTTSIRNLRPWHFKFRGRAIRQTTLVSTARQQQQNDMGALSENPSSV